MRHFPPLVAAVLFLWGTATAQDTPVEPWQAFTARVAEVTGGDTVGVRRSTDGEVTIRLRGTDALESVQAYGTAATRSVRRYRDREGHWGLAVGRPLRRRCAPLRDAERELRSDDHPPRARHYRQYTPNEAEYRRLRRQARGADRDLWSQAGPTPPWEWQDRQSDSSNKATAQTK